MAESMKSASHFWKRVILKGVLLFLLLNFLFVPLDPLPALGRISAYNLVFPGRLRLPYGEVPDQAYNLSLYNLDAMFASHELAGRKKPASEYRVILIGDSSVWGYLLKPENTLAAYLNTSGLKVSDGRTIHAYNLGYPTMSITKDLLILSHAMQYQPDLVIWLITLESLPVQKQLDSPILQNNPSSVRDLITQYSLDLDLQDPRFAGNSFLSRTIIGQRRDLADILRLQLYGVSWAATGIDQYYPASYEPPQEDLDPNLSFQGLQPPVLDPNDLAMEVLSAGSTMAGNVPVLFVNEPIYISQGQNSEVRYNFFYPQWAYDQYRNIFSSSCHQNGWQCLDEWDLVPADEFTNSAIHMNRAGTQALAFQLQEAILSFKLH
jgi:hypothetical protein